MKIFWKALAGIICPVALLLAVWYFSTYTLSVTRVELESDKIDTKVNIVQLTDLHGAVFGRGNRRIINKITAPGLNRRRYIRDEGTKPFMPYLI